MPTKKDEQEAPQTVTHIQTVAVDRWDDDGDQQYRVTATVDGEAQQRFVKQPAYDAVPREALPAYVQALFGAGAAEGDEEN